MTDARALGDVLAPGAGGVVEAIRDTHRAVAARAFGAAPFGGVPRRAHDAISALVYAAVGASSRAASRGGAHLPSQLRLDDSVRGRAVLGALNGAWGDLLADRGSPLAFTLGFHPAAPEAGPHTGRVAVLVHGLCETEDAWRLGEERSRPYPDRLRDAGFTPLLARCNTGLRISANGRALAELLEETLAAWPVPVEEVALIGHSMGGLISRSACHHATGEGLAWVRDVRHVVSLGSPYGGADLEKAANVAGWALGRLPETRALAAALNRRSAGIKDLRYGALTDACWDGHDPDELLRDRRCEVPWLEDAQHTFVAASLTADPAHPLGRLAGDLLVRQVSAWAGGQHGEDTHFREESSHVIGAANHFTLLNHPGVWELLERLLGVPDPVAA